MVWAPKYSPILKDFDVQKSLKPAGLSRYDVKKALTTARDFDFATHSNHQARRRIC
jgi:hypothetical protein